MKTRGDQSQEFNTTFIIAIIVAAILAIGVVGLIYGCMKANHAPQTRPVGEIQFVATSPDFSPVVGGNSVPTKLNG